MHLTDDEALHAAKTLCEANTSLHWHTLSDDEQKAYTQLVKDLAALLNTPKTPEALKVFYIWMGETP